MSAGLLSFLRARPVTLALSRRGRVIGLELARFAVDEGGLAETKWILHTRDMQRLYAKLGFRGPGERTMERGRMAGTEIQRR